MQTLAQRLRGDRPLKLLPVQHILSPSPMQQILLPSLPIHPTRPLRRAACLGGNLPAPAAFPFHTSGFGRLRDRRYAVPTNDQQEWPDGVERGLA